MSIGPGNVTVKSNQLRIPPSMEALQSETQRHPELMAQLKAPDAVKTFEDGLAIIAAYVDVVLDGIYQIHELDHLCGVLVRKLRDKRGAIIIVSG